MWPTDLQQRNNQMQQETDTTLPTLLGLTHLSYPHLNSRLEAPRANIFYIGGTRSIKKRRLRFGSKDQHLKRI